MILTFKNSDCRRYLSLFFLGVILALVFFLIPTIAHAESIETTLKTNQNIKNLHASFLNIINIPIVLVVVFMAFAEMLHLKIDTYGFKKILPTLILSIIAAQFSYLVCKLIIDAANMLMTLFTDQALLGQYLTDKSGNVVNSIVNNYNTNTTGMGQGLMPDVPNWSTFEYGDFFKNLLGIIVLLVGSVVALILAFLFIVRQWMIYFLVVISSVAFMMLALPQTKTYFTKWWQEFFRWTFMPVVSLAILWFGGVFLRAKIGDTNGLHIPMVSAIVAILCLWFSVSVPIKMGGVVMQKYLQFTGAKWGMAKAKTKWIDPALQFWKDKTLNWWHAQASGSQNRFSHLNPIGAIARRGLRVEEWRRAESETTKTSKEGALRWALGGKPIVEYYDEKTGKMTFKYKFFSNKGRRRFSKHLDDVKSDMGEADYIRKQLDLDWKMNTPEGQLAVGRSVAYAQRVGAVDNMLKTQELRADSMGYAENNGKNWFLQNTSFGIVPGDHHWKRQKEFFVTAEQELKTAELANQKFKNDRIKFDYQPAATLTMLKEEIDALKANEESQKEGTKAAKQLARAMKRWEKAINKIQSDKTLWDKNANSGAGDFTSNAITLKRMLTDSQGKFIGSNVDNVQSLTKLWGYDNAPEDLRKLFVSRMRKYTSILAKEEVTSEAGKRIAIESAKRAIDKFRDEVEDMFSGMQSGVWLNTHKDGYGALKNSLVDARNENAPVIYGMYVDMLKGIASSADSTEEMKQNALDILASGQKQSMRTSLQQSAIMDNVIDSAAKEYIGEEKWEGYSGEKKLEEVAKLRTEDKDFRIKVQDKLHEAAVRITRQESAELAKIVKIKYDKHGRVHVFTDTSTNTNLATELLGNMNSQAVNFNERERNNVEGQQRLSTIAGLASAMPTSQEAITFFENCISHEAQEKKAQMKAEEKAKFDAINE